MLVGMELKVWVEGIQRIVCGVTETTTCQDVVFALAHATGKTGRFTLIERWRNNERLLAPDESPLKILMKWGEYSNDVQFILQRSALDPKTPNGPVGPRPGGPQRVDPSGRSLGSTGQQNIPEGSKPPNISHRDLKKSLTFSGGHAELRRHEVGVSSQPIVGPTPGHVSQSGSRHGEPTYASSQTAPHWDGVTRTVDGGRGDQQNTPAWRPPAPPPYELVRGNPPPPPPVASRGGVDNVRAITSHWTTPRPGPHSNQTQPPHSPPAAVHHSPSRGPLTSESAYATSRRDQRSDTHTLARTEPVYSDGRRAPFPGYTHQSAGMGFPQAPSYNARGPPSQVNSLYNGPPPPKPPHILHPRELPPYRHPPHPSVSPKKISQSHSSPRKSGLNSQSPSASQMSPTKQLPQHSVTHISHSHQPGVPPQSSPMRHPSPTRQPSPTRHPSPTRRPSPTRHSSPSRIPYSHARSTSPVKGICLRHSNSEDLLARSSPDKNSVVMPREERTNRSEDFSHQVDDGSRLDNEINIDKLANSIVKSNPDAFMKNQRRGSTDRLADSGPVPGHRGVSEEPRVNSDMGSNKHEERLNTSLDSAFSNHIGKSPHARRSPTKECSVSSDVNRSNHGINNNNNSNNKMEQVVMDGRYRDLIKLINLQREKLNVQQVEMTKYEAEIVYLEGRSREDESRLAYVTSEIEKQEQLAQQIDQEVCHLQQLEKEAENARQAEEKVKSEISSLQAQLAHCENQLASHNETVRSAQNLEKSMNDERQRHQEEAQAQQDAMMREIEKLQTAITEATAQAENAQLASQQLMQEMTESERAIAEKKKEVEKLVTEMKDANLESLSITPSEEIRNLLEGAPKPGSSRRMIGSPRQLENAVPTSKNPHGVWV
ncbi:Ras association domain-containing protein 8 [Halocaridina rubra]|uniref:Ras association domain-containing protein 8 n=1 Tax=Halocaridina rubra TaxID=373956 RepID=A0AAN8X9V6_HALRR